MPKKYTFAIFNEQNMRKAFRSHQERKFKQKWLDRKSTWNEIRIALLKTGKINMETDGYINRLAQAVRHYNDYPQECLLKEVDPDPDYRADLLEAIAERRRELYEHLGVTEIATPVSNWPTPEKSPF